MTLIERSGTKYINEPHIGGGNPVLSIGDKDSEVIFTDMLGTSIGKVEENGYSSIDKTSFGADNSDNSSFFTGKPYVEDLGYVFLFRNYRADMGKWLSQDLIGYPDGWNNFTYCCNDVLDSLDFLGADTLTICSSSKGSASSFNVSGHAWVVYTDNSGRQTTYGTWGEVAASNYKSGLYTNLEAGRSAEAKRTYDMTDSDLKEFNKIINEYREKGEDAWTYTDPCSDFAADVWSTVTGEDLGSFWIWDTPSDLVESIKKANGDKSNGKYTPSDNDGSSSLPE